MMAAYNRIDNRGFISANGGTSDNAPGGHARSSINEEILPEGYKGLIPPGVTCVSQVRDKP